MKIELDIDDRLVRTVRIGLSARGALLGLALGLVTATVVTAAPLERVPNVFNSGDVIRASEINDNFVEVVAAVDAVDAAVSALSGVTDGLVDDVDAQDGRLDNLEIDVDAQDGRLDTLEADVSSLGGVSQRIDAVDARVTGLTGVTDNLRGDVDGQNGRLDTLEANLTWVGGGRLLRVTETGANDGSASCDNICNATGLGFCVGGASTRTGQYISCSTVVGGAPATTPCWCARP